MAGKYAKKQKRPWIAAVLPWKGDRAGEAIRKIVFLVALITFLVTGGILLWEMVIQPAMVDNKANYVQQIYHVDDNQNNTATNEDSEYDENGNLKKFVELQKINPDIKGWIRIADTVVDYPILQSGEDNPEYYLYLDYEKNHSKYGSLFFDARNSINLEDPSSKSLIVYGHSMNDGRMFGSLLNYGSLDYYKEHPTFEMDTVKYNGDWKIFSVFKTNTLSSQGEPFNYLRTSFSSDSDFIKFIYQMEILSLFNTGVDVSADDQIVLLSTCSYEMDGFRTVIAARKVREGEDTAVDTSKATWNQTVLYPDGWYSAKGGTKPQHPATFEEALAQGKINWLAEK